MQLLFGGETAAEAGGVGCAQCSMKLSHTWPVVQLLGSVALLISCPVESTHLEPVVLVGRQLKFICQEA